MIRRSRLVPALASGLVASLALSTYTAAPAHADDPTPLYVVGTSDVSDSNLMSAVIEPAFEKAYPQYDLRYTGSATGAAIASAEAGNAAALLVHAMPLENQFVADGYSAETFGRALFWGDFVLAGPASDPAGVLDGSAHDIVSAFEKVAAAGADGDAIFVSRGGNPGTTVQEHALWELADSTKVTLCTVKSSNGGGASPYSASGTCPDNIGTKGGDTGDAGFPSWYKATGVTQAPNIMAANTCSWGDDDCYVFTDRGTYQNQAALTPAASWNLSLMVRNNDASARGGIPGLVNTFHGYVINPDQADLAGQTGLKTDVKGGKAFLHWLTSPAGQATVGAYQNPDPSFLPSAAPKLTVSQVAPGVKAGKALTVTGSIANVVPGMPALNGVPVHLEAVPAAGPGYTRTRVATATTDAQGRFTLRYTPRRSMIYTVATDQITQLEDASLDPTFSDLLQPTRASVGSSTVAGTVSLVRAKVAGRKVTVRGTFGTASPDAHARITVLVHKQGKKKFTARRSFAVAAGTSRFVETVRLPKGRWVVAVKYADGSAFTAATSNTRKVRIR